MVGISHHPLPPLVVLQHLCSNSWRRFRPNGDSKKPLVYQSFINTTNSSFPQLLVSSIVCGCFSCGKTKCFIENQTRRTWLIRRKSFTYTNMYCTTKIPHRGIDEIENQSKAIQIPSITTDTLLNNKWYSFR